MKRLLVIILLCISVHSVLAKTPNERTFLVIFDNAELKKNKTSTEYIELSLMHIFNTKSYSGNSDAAILIKTDHAQIDKCVLGDFIIRFNQNQISTLDEIAFQIIDLDECREFYLNLLADFEEKNSKTKKNNKLFKSTL
ncbi:hypothetical protein ACFOUP_09880 [Belliella kenyensis]|uniref:Uncharacterized protein n=1 Tax=Belliella kenyensis TaxID=1472724 RepID=A0ABV8EMD0_9BACT|nr:hypothetical protein [Belliella kenyensis]MCH7403019.1 hypothetical protein [Belliella kenyensis]MDN3605055.1 hypothetical protein [Belliella kenyensis]